MNPDSWTPPLQRFDQYKPHPASIVPTVQLVVSVSGRIFKADADTLPEAEEKITEMVSAAIEEAGAHIDRMEGFLAAR